MVNVGATSARKALSLGKDKIFRLLVVMMVLLGWLIGMGSASLVGLQNVYETWRLSQESKVSVYLLADSAEETIKDMNKELTNLRGVERIERLSTEQVAGLLSPYFAGEEKFPLPIVLDITVATDVDREMFDHIVLSHFVGAEIDDARALLERAAQGVRLLQWAALAFSAVLLVVMALIVSLTVRAGLRGIKESLEVLQYVGATDRFLSRLITRQVLYRSLIGFVGASILSALCVWAATHWLPSLKIYISSELWAASLAAPFALVVLAVLSAWATSHNVIKKHG